MRRVLCCAALGAACLALALPAPAEDRDRKGDKDKGTLRDADFVRLASAAGLAEVNLSLIADKRASSADVKTFAQRMVKDHTKANAELLNLANKKMLTAARTMDKQHMDVRDRLLKEEGAAFDRDYMRTMVKDHDEAVALFDKASKGLKDEELRNWARKTLPTLREHRKMAREVADKVKGSSGKGKEGDKDRRR